MNTELYIFRQNISLKNFSWCDKSVKIFKDDDHTLEHAISNDVRQGVWVAA